MFVFKFRQSVEIQQEGGAREDLSWADVVLGDAAGAAVKRPTVVVRADAARACCGFAN